MCTNNSNCTCTDNTCGCKTSTSEVVYQGPSLTCVGINNCDTITEVLQKLNSYICSEELVTIIINNIITNVDLYQQFTTIVNNSVECETVWGCETTSTTTTVAPTTTTTTTEFACTTYTWASIGDNISDLEYFDCDNVSVKIDRVDVTDNSGFICVYPGTTPVWNPTPSTGYHDISTTGITCVKP